MKRFTIFFLAMSSLTTSGAGAESLKEKYPPPWLYDFHPAITKALSGADVEDCGSYRYRVSSGSKSEFLVYCSSDDEHWMAYLVWPNIVKVLGPYQTDPSIP